MLLQDLAELNWLPMAGPAIRTEEQREGDRYLLRAELPGIDPAKDIDIRIGTAVLSAGGAPASAVVMNTNCRYR
jgi:HSP20 family molecular chaperone IbpA